MHGTAWTATTADFMISLNSFPVLSILTGPTSISMSSLGCQRRISWTALRLWSKSSPATVNSAKNEGISLTFPLTARGLGECHEVGHQWGWDDVFNVNKMVCFKISLFGWKLGTIPVVSYAGTEGISVCQTIQQYESVRTEVLQVGRQRELFKLWFQATILQTAALMTEYMNHWDWNGEWSASSAITWPLHIFSLIEASKNTRSQVTHFHHFIFHYSYIIFTE